MDVEKDQNELIHFQLNLMGNRALDNGGFGKRR